MKRGEGRKNTYAKRGFNKMTSEKTLWQNIRLNNMKKYTMMLDEMG